MIQETIPIGIVIPVHNESAALPKLISSLVDQLSLDSACCMAFVDGCSEDDSRSIIAAYQTKLPMLRLIDNPRRITPVAFNLGIAACLEAGAEAVLLFGAHGWLESEFLSKLQQILRSTDADIIGAVHRYPKPACRFETAVQAFSESRLGRRLNFFSKLKAPTPTNIAFSPTIRRRVFERIGFFDETMIRNQDNDFTSRARAAGLRIVTDPGLHHIYVPRKTFSQQLRQLYNNGYWGGRRLKVVGVKQFAPAIFWGGLILSMVLGLVVGGHWQWIIYAWATPYILAVVATTLVWAFRIGPASIWLPALFAGGHAVFALGTFKALLESFISSGHKN